MEALPRSTKVLKPSEPKVAAPALSRPCSSSALANAGRCGSGLSLGGSMEAGGRWTWISRWIGRLLQGSHWRPLDSSSCRGAGSQGEDRIPPPPPPPLSLAPLGSLPELLCCAGVSSQVLHELAGLWLAVVDSDEEEEGGRNGEELLEQYDWEGYEEGARSMSRRASTATRKTTHVSDVSRPTGEVAHPGAAD